MLRLALAACLAAGPALAGEEIQFYQTVDRNEVGTEDTFRLTVVISNAPDDALPQFTTPNDFEVLGRPSTSTEMSYHFGGGGPGTVQRVVKHVFVMRANKAGKFVIPPSVLTTANKTYKTEAISMTVKKGRLREASPRPQPGFGNLPDPFRNFFPGFPDDPPGGDGFPEDMDIPRSDSDLFVKAALDKDTVYVGEQATLTLWIFSRVDISSVDNLNLPKLDGFWSEDIDSPSQLSPEQRVINGIPYRAYLLKRVALFPMRPGSTPIAATSVEISTGFLFRQAKAKRESNELTLKVKALPAGAPAAFAPNNVGKWRLSTEAVQNQVELGQPVTMRVILDGRGNLKNVSPPALTGPASLKIFDPTTLDKLMPVHFRLGGRRVQEYLVVPQQTGTFELPGLSFAYFDTDTGHYETSKTDPIRLTVLPGAGGATALPGATAAGPGTGPVAVSAKNVLNAGGLKPLRLAAAFVPIERPFWRRTFFAPAVAAPFGLWLLVALAAVVRGELRREDAGTQKKRKARAARRRLAQAEKLRAKGEPSAFYGEVEKALATFLEAKLGVPVVGLTRDALTDRLKATGVADERALKVRRVLEACDMGRFAPGVGDLARTQVLDQAEEAMESWV